MAEVISQTEKQSITGSLRRQRRLPDWRGGRCWKANERSGVPRDLEWWLIDAGFSPAGRNAYAATGSPTLERHRPLEGELTCRYFLPVRKQF